MKRNIKSSNSMEKHKKMWVYIINKTHLTNKKNQQRLVAESPKRAY
jgi:hypothetical protein